MNVKEQQSNNQQQSQYATIMQQQQSDDKSSNCAFIILGAMTALIVFILVNPQFEGMQAQRFQVEKKRVLQDIQDQIQKKKQELSKKKMSSPSFHGQLASTVLTTFILGNQEQFYRLEKQSYTKNYEIDKYPQKAFCIIVPTYNNFLNSSAIFNMQSILQQQYNNYKVLILDDQSTDNTYQFIKDYVSTQEVELQKKITLARNNNDNVFQSIYMAAYDFCEEQDIMMVFDGDDFLVGKQVFKLLNAVYQKEDIWFAYANYLIREGLPGFPGDNVQYMIENSFFRGDPNFQINNAITFYTKLFRKISQSYLMDQNKRWVSTDYNLLMYFPMIQMAKNHTKYVPQFVYYDRMGVNKRKAKYPSIEDQLRKTKRFKQLKSLF